MGSHRVGKSSLARAYAEKTGAVFLETATSGIWEELGYNPAVTHDFSTRLTVQREILKYLDGLYANAPTGATVVTDRTPIDLIAYTMAEAIGDKVSEEDQGSFARYVQDCFDVCNRRFSVLVLVQPGIPLVAAKGKAALNLAYMEHLNSLCLGLSVDDRVKVAHFYIQRHVHDMQERVKSVENARNRSMRLHEAALERHLESGASVH